MEMGNYVSDQLLLFLRAIGLGVCLGVLYDVLRALRRLGGKIWGGVLDGLFCMTAAVSVLFFVLAGDGELRIFMVLGAAGGALLFWCLLGGLLRPVWAFWVALALLPVRLVRKVLKKCVQIGKKVFSFCESWVTIAHKRFCPRGKPGLQEGDDGMSGPAQKRPQKKAGKRTRPSGKLTLLFLAALMLAISAQIYRMFGQLQAARAEEASYAQQLAELQETTQQLKDDLANSGSISLIEDIARDQLGMVGPGEKVFHFSK